MFDFWFVWPASWRLRIYRKNAEAVYRFLYRNRTQYYYSYSTNSRTETRVLPHRHRLTVVRLQRKRDVRSKLARLDASVLRDEPARSAFAHNVLKRLDSSRAVSASLSLGAKDADGHVSVRLQLAPTPPSAGMPPRRSARLLPQRTPLANVTNLPAVRVGQPWYM